MAFSAGYIKHELLGSMRNAVDSNSESIVFARLHMARLNSSERPSDFAFGNHHRFHLFIRNAFQCALFLFYHRDADK